MEDEETTETSEPAELEISDESTTVNIVVPTEAAPQNDAAFLALSERLDSLEQRVNSLDERNRPVEQPTGIDTATDNGTGTDTEEARPATEEPRGDSRPRSRHWYFRPFSWW